MKLTKDQAIILTGFTGVLCCDFSDFHADVERRMGHPVWVHQFASNKGKVKDLYRDDFLAMLPNGTPMPSISDGDQR